MRNISPLSGSRGLSSWRETFPGQGVFQNRDGGDYHVIKREAAFHSDVNGNCERFNQTKKRLLGRHRIAPSSTKYACTRSGSSGSCWRRSDGHKV